MDGSLANMSVGELAAELQQRVTMFHAGDERYSGAWLADFQRTGGTAWQICIEALRPGPLPSCDEELLQGFCAQTLARLSRSFNSWHGPEARAAGREALMALLALHARGQSLVWKQLALAVVCAELWLGTWTASTALASVELPMAVRRELLVLPTELLFCERALPLGDRRLIRQASAALVSSCETVFPFLLGGWASEASSARDGRHWIQVLTAWLRAVRKSISVTPGCDGAAPLRCLAAQGQQLQAAIRDAPCEAAALTQQLVRWPSGWEQEAAAVLRPLLLCLFTAASKSSFALDRLLTGDEDLVEAGDTEEEGDELASSLLPLLQDLAGGCWPRAAFGDFDLDWTAITSQAMALLRRTLSASMADHGAHVSSLDPVAALQVWQTFAETVLEALRQGEIPASNAAVAGGATSSTNTGRVEPPEKRSRRSQRGWQLSVDKVAQSDSLKKLSGLLVHQFLALLRLPKNAQEDELEAIVEARHAAHNAWKPWYQLARLEQSWLEELWAPLQRVPALLAAGTSFDQEKAEELLVEVEVLLWFSGLCAAVDDDDETRGQPATPGFPGTAVLTLLPHLSVLDTAPPRWRLFLWGAVYPLATVVCPGQVLNGRTAFLEWVLQRPPRDAGAPELQHLLELSFAQSVEVACRRLPPGSSHPAAGERLFALAFADWPAGGTQVAVRDDSNQEVQAALLRALRFTMGGNADLMCQSMSLRVLPHLCSAVDGEAAHGGSSSSTSTPGGAEGSWTTAQTFFSTLVSTLPVECYVGKAAHPAAKLWLDSWRYFEAAVLHWQRDPASDQPVLSAVEALVAAGIQLPSLLPHVSGLLVRSVAATPADSELCLEALHDVILRLSCPPVDAEQAADLFCSTVASVAEVILQQPQAELQENLGVLTAFFRLMSEALRPSRAGKSETGPCQDRLRPRLIVRSELIGSCLRLAIAALPDCTSEAASQQMLRFALQLLSLEDAQTQQHYETVAQLLGPLLAAMCQAFAAQRYLSDMDVLQTAGDLLLAVAAAFPKELPEALTAAVSSVRVSEHAQSLLLKHVASTATWQDTGLWMEELQQVVSEWQAESRLLIL